MHRCFFARTPCIDLMQALCWCRFARLLPAPFSLLWGPLHPEESSQAQRKDVCSAAPLLRRASGTCRAATGRAAPAAPITMLC